MDAPLFLVEFRFRCEETNEGDTLVVMGDWLNWDEDRALEMKCIDFPQWECEACVPSGMREFKLLVVRSNSQRKWEPCDSNRTIEVGEGCRCTATGTFGKGNRNCDESLSATSITKSCQRCGSVVSCYSNCPKCWGPVTKPPRTVSK